MMLFNAKEKPPTMASASDRLKAAEKVDAADAPPSGHNTITAPNRPRATRNSARGVTASCSRTLASKTAHKGIR